MVEGAIIFVTFVLIVASTIGCVCMNNKDEAYEECYWEMESNRYAFSGACGGLGGACINCPFYVGDQKGESE